MLKKFEFSNFILIIRFRIQIQEMRYLFVKVQKRLVVDDA